MIGAHAVNKYVRDVPDSRMLPTTLNKATALENYAASQGILFGFPDYSGWRSEADTTQLTVWRDEAVAAHGPNAYYPVAPYGVGYHGKGAAFDVKVVKWPTGKTADWAYRQLGAYAPIIGLRWGGTFGGKSTDPYHFELAITVAAAQAAFTKFQQDQRALQLSGKPAVILTPSSLSQQQLLTFTNFQVPTNPAVLPKSLSEIGSILQPRGAVPIVFAVALAFVAVGFFLIGVVARLL